MSLKSLIQKMDELSETTKVLNETSKAEYQARKAAKTAGEREKNITAASRELQDVMIGKLPKEKPGTTSVTHKTPDFDVSDDDEELKEESNDSVPLEVRKLYTSTYAKRGGTIAKAKEAEAAAYAAVEKKYGKEMCDKLKKQHAANREDVTEAAKWRRDDLKGKTWRSKDWDDGELGPDMIQIDRSGKDVDNDGDELNARPGMWGGKYKRMTKKGTPTQAELGMQNNLKMRIKQQKKQGGLSGPKGPLPEEQDVAEDQIDEIKLRNIIPGLGKLIARSREDDEKIQARWAGVQSRMDGNPEPRFAGDYPEDTPFDDVRRARDRHHRNAKRYDRIAQGKPPFAKDGVAESTIPTSLAGWMNLVEGKTVSEEVVKAPVPVQQNGQSELATLTSTSSDPADANVLKAAAEILKRGQGQIQLPKSTQQSSQQGTTSQSKGATTSAGATNQPQQMSEEEIDEVAAPGQEDWIKKNKQRFIDQYGKKKGLSVLYATAWKRSKDTTESVEKNGDQSSEKTQPDPWKHVDDRVDNPVIKGTNQRAKTGVFPTLKKVERLKEPYLKENNDSEQIMNQNKQQVMEGYTLEDIEESHPHEVKMCHEGWGLDESLYEALADYYHKQGQIPRKVWHGPLDELRDFVLDCYLKDKSPLLGEQSFTQASPGDSQFGPLGVEEGAIGSAVGTGLGRMAGTAVGGPIGGMVGGAVGGAIGSHIGDELQDKADELLSDDIADDEMVDISDDDLDSEEFPFPDMEDELEMSPEDEEDMEQDDLLDEVDYMEEEIMYESKMKKHKRGMAEEKKETKTGVIHKAEAGGYGRKDDEDDEGKKVKPAVKRGRGRPKKDADSETGEVKKWDTDELARWIVGSKPKSLPGKASVKHKLKDESVKKKDAQMEGWDRQLQQLLSEGMTVTTSTGQNGMGDSVSVSATDADAQELMKVLQSAGIGMGSGMKSASAEPHSHEGQPISVEPASSDEVMGQLQPEEDGGDDALGFLKKMIGLRGGDTSQVDAAHSHGDYEEEDHDHDEDEECETCGESPCCCDDEEGVVMVGEEDVEEGNKFTGELAKARKDGVQKGETMKVDGKEYPVKPGKKTEDMHDSEHEDDEEHKERCDECGGIMEANHTCGQEKLDEWANSPMGKSADEQFETELNYMTKLISGGLNGMKRDQTTLPHTKVKTDIAEDNIKAMKKLAGI